MADDVCADHGASDTDTVREVTGRPAITLARYAATMPSAGTPRDLGVRTRVLDQPGAGLRLVERAGPEPAPIRSDST